MTLRAALAGAALAALLGAPAAADPGARAPEAPPAKLIAGEPARGDALDPVFAHLQLDRFACKFTEEKRVALLARPLRSAGTIHFQRDRGIALVTLTPRPQQVVLTATTLRIRNDKRTEEIPLDKSKDLKAFALIFPTLLRGDRAGLERAFELGLYGGAADWWALAFTPRTKALRELVRGVVVIGRKRELISLRVTEASGDTTETQLTDIRKNGEVPDAEITAAFGAP